MKFPGIETGKTLTIRRTVTERDTFGNHLPDDISSLLSSPGLASMMIDASSSLLNSLLPDGYMSVGKSVCLTHEHPSLVGCTVELTVNITGFDGYHVTLGMEATDDTGLIGTGSHVRTIVNKRWLQLGIERRHRNL